MANPSDGPDRRNVTALVLAGGAGRRLGGHGKGWQLLAGRPLARWVLERLQAQVDGPVWINANPPLEAFQDWGVPIVADDLPERPGPLVGLLAGLVHAPTPWVLTAACDAPAVPMDLLHRLATAARQGRALAAVAVCPHPETLPGEAGRRRWQPVHALVHRSQADALRSWIEQGGRKAEDGLRHLGAVEAPFDDPQAFENINTPQDLQAFERRLQAPPPDATIGP